MGSYLPPAMSQACRMQCRASRYPYAALTVAAIVQEEALQKVVDFLGCSRSFARTLLIHFRWDSDVLFGALAVHGKRAGMTAAGIVAADASMPAP